MTDETLSWRITRAQLETKGVPEKLEAREAFEVEAELGQIVIALVRARTGVDLCQTQGIKGLSPLLSQIVEELECLRAQIKTPAAAHEQPPLRSRTQRLGMPVVTTEQQKLLVAQKESP